jgi:hypothetical protein
VQISRVLEGVKGHLELALCPERYRDAATLGWFYPRSLTVNPKAERLRVVVREPASGAVGSVSIPFAKTKAHEATPSG